MSSRRLYCRQGRRRNGGPNQSPLDRFRHEVPFMKHLLILTAALWLAVFSCKGQAQTTEPASMRERLSLDRGWLFHEGDIPFPVINGHQMSYDNAKSGRAWGAAAPDYDDTSWKSVDLPHDWAVEQLFDQKANLSE